MKIGGDIACDECIKGKDALVQHSVSGGSCLRCGSDRCQRHFEQQGEYCNHCKCSIAVVSKLKMIRERRSMMVQPVK